MHGVLRDADFCKADIQGLIEEARLWLASVITFREDADPDVIARFTRRDATPARPTRGRLVLLSDSTRPRASLATTIRAGRSGA